MREYFCGWYFKCRSESKTLAVIPALHRTKENRSCSIQLITDTGSFNVRFPYHQFRKIGSAVEIGKNRFAKEGIHLNINAPGVSAKGNIRFGEFSPIRYDIMGPFKYVPFMECRHSVLSMRHSVNGRLDINGTPYEFHNGIGYLEGDRGSSFPREYAWTQCSFEDGSLMLSAADIPLGPFRFTGIIGVILWKGKEYRLATYLGAKPVRIQDGEIVVRQGNSRLTVVKKERSSYPLAAPAGGAMTRTIHENAACHAFYRFEKDGRTLFEFDASDAAFEYEFPY